MHLILVQICLVVAAKNVQEGGTGAFEAFANAGEERRVEENLKSVSDMLVWDTVGQNEDR